MDIPSDEVNNLLLQEQTELMENASGEIKVLIENLQQFFLEFEEKIAQNQDAKVQHVVKEFENCKFYVLEYIDFIHTEIGSIFEAIQESDNQLAARDRMIANLNRQIDEQNKTIEKQNRRIEEQNKAVEEQKNEVSDYKEKFDEQKRLTDEITQMYEQQKQHIDTIVSEEDENVKIIKDLERKCQNAKEESKLTRTYSAATGSVLGTMLWKTSKSQEAIETYIETGNMNEFLNLTNNTVIAFRETYNNQLPDAGTYEYKFILSLMGICINIVATRIGREFLIENGIGEEIVKSLIRYLEDIPLPQGMLFKHLILMFLYNITLTNQGIIMLQLFDASIDNIMECFSSRHSADCQSVAVKIMDILMNDPPKTEQFFTKVERNLTANEDGFKEMLANPNDGLNIISAQFMSKLQSLKSEMLTDQDFF